MHKQAIIRRLEADAKQTSEMVRESFFSLEGRGRLMAPEPGEKNKPAFVEVVLSWLEGRDRIQAY